MKILQVLPELNVGGVETGTIDLAKFLSAHHIANVVVSSGGRLVEQLETQDIVHHVLPVNKKSLFSMIKCVGALRKIIIQEEIDIVHARSRVPAWIAYFACRKTSANFVTTCHGYYSKHWFSRVMGWGKLVIVPSHIIGRHMVETFRVSSDRIRHIPRSVDLTKFKGLEDIKKNKTHRIVTIVGRITPLKGHTFFLKAMVKVIRSMPYVKIWVIGDASSEKDSYKQEVVTLVKRLGISDNVEFLGSRSDVPALLAQSDVLVMASVRPESFGRAILEAQAAGVPVVATKLGGPVEIIEDKKTGILVPPKDIEAMANAVLKIFGDKLLARTMVDAAQKKIEDRYTLGHMTGDTLKVYSEVMDRQNILVVKIGSLGDVVLVVASLKAIRKKYPKAYIQALVDKEYCYVLQRCPYIDGIIAVDFKGKDKGYWRIVKLARELRKCHFDKIIDFQNNRKSHLLAFLTFAQGTYGYNNRKWGFLLKHAIKDLTPLLPPIEHQFKVLEMLNIPFSNEYQLELWPSEKERQKARRLLENEWINSGTKLVGINISASAKWKTKNWPVSRIAELCNILAVQNIRVVITGMKVDLPLTQTLMAKAKTRPVNLVGKTSIMELAGVIERCQVFVTPDSAPLHIAAAMKTPIVALFGPTSSKRHLPPIVKCKVIEKTLKCSSCYSTKCQILTHACMETVSAFDVADAVMDLMED